MDPLEHDLLEPVRLDVARRTLVVVAGLPGAGKSTLLRGLHTSDQVAVLDTDQMRARLAVRFPHTPYGRYRPLVHVLHEARVLVALIRAPGPVVVHDPATGALTRAVFVVLAALTGRVGHLFWIDCTEPEAVDGQRSRGRVLPRWSFRRHARRAPRIRARLLAGRPPRGWCGASVTDRSAARAGLHLRVAQHDTGRR